MQIDRPVHRPQIQLRAALPDGSADLTARQLASNHQREIGRDATVHRAGMQRGIDGRRQFKIDATVYRMELSRPRSRRLAKARDDRTVHRLTFSPSGCRYANLAVYSVRLDLTSERSCFDFSIHSPADEVHAGRDLHGKLNPDVVVVRAHASPRTGRAFVRLSPIARWIHCAHRDAAVMRNHLHGYRMRITVTRALDRLHDHFGPRRPLRQDRAVHTLDFDGLAWRDWPTPRKVGGLCDRRHRAERNQSQDDSSNDMHTSSLNLGDKDSLAAVLDSTCFRP